MKTIKFLLFAVTMTLSITSCIEDKPLENDKPVNPQTIQNMRQAFVDATDGATPLLMGHGEWALFRIQAKLYTGDFQGLGYKAAQVVDAKNGDMTVEGNLYHNRDLRILLTDYKEPSSPEEMENPVIELQKEWPCTFVKPPFYIWWTDCPLPMEQNFWVFNSIQEPEVPIFYSLAKYVVKEKLPKKMVDEGRCYNFVNCEINVTYLEYEMYGKDENGEDKRVHYVTSFSGDLPYLASNLKTCYSTLLDLEGKKHPAEVCQLMVDFKPGSTPPAYCPDNNPEVPCVESAP
ncbi:MAG: hypothetical protein V4596_13685 [Bdellovibrionota bacterium]